MKRAGYLAFVLGVALLAFLVLRANWPVLLHALKSLGVSGLLILAALHLPVIAAAGVAWWYFGRPAPGATLFGFVRARLVRDAVAVTLPFSQVGGIAAGVRVLARSGVPAVWSGLSTFADLVSEFASLFPYVAIGLLALAAVAPSSSLLRPIAFGASAALALLIGAMIVRRRVAKWLRAPARALLARFTGNVVEKIRGERAGIDLSPRAIAGNAGLHFGRWAVGAVETWVAFALMGVPLSLEKALIVDCVSASLRILAFMVPAAVGVQEGIYVLVCGIVGLPPAVALAFSFVWRARDLLIGCLGLALWHSIEAKSANRPIAANARRASGTSGDGYHTWEH